jgi:hypothetical protein
MSTGAQQLAAHAQLKGRLMVRMQPGAGHVRTSRVPPIA